MLLGQKRENVHNRSVDGVSLWRPLGFDIKGCRLIKRHKWGMHAAMPISVRFHRQRICWLPVASDALLSFAQAFRLPWLHHAKAVRSPFWGVPRGPGPPSLGRENAVGAHTWGELGRWCGDRKVGESLERPGDQHGAWRPCYCVRLRVAMRQRRYLEGLEPWNSWGQTHPARFVSAPSPVTMATLKPPASRPCMASDLPSSACAILASVRDGPRTPATLAGQSAAAPHRPGLGTEYSCTCSWTLPMGAFLWISLSQAICRSGGSPVARCLSEVHRLVKLRCSLA
jgi:hypothetical protein